MSLGMVIIDTEKLRSLERLPESNAVNPRSLKATEHPETFGTVLPGKNARKTDGTEPRLWFRQAINDDLEKANFGGESLAETLFALLRDERRPNCPNNACREQVEVPAPRRMGACSACAEPVYLSDALRIHTQFVKSSQLWNAMPDFTTLFKSLP